MENYTIVKKLGEGSFGSAYLVKTKTDNKQSVMKEVNMTKVGFE